MTTTRDSAEQIALRGLLLLVVEVQNIVRVEGEDPRALLLERVRELVESAPAAELIQLARAALATQKATT